MRMSKYFQEHHSCMPIKETTSWGEIEKTGALAPRGWLELVKLDQASRLEFVEQFWASKLMDYPLFVELLPMIFQQFEDILFFLVQSHPEEPFVPHLVYTLKGDKGFFYGTPALEFSEIEEHRLSCGEPLPEDFLKFQEIHETFSQDGKGRIYSVKHLIDTRAHLEKFFKKRPPLLFYDGSEVDLKKLIPFYGSFGRYSWQCFCADWYPEEEMGNVLITHDTVFLPLLGEAEGLSFSSFLEWLASYLGVVVDVSG